MPHVMSRTSADVRPSLVWKSSSFPSISFWDQMRRKSAHCPGNTWILAPPHVCQKSTSPQNNTSTSTAPPYLCNATHKIVWKSFHFVPENGKTNRELSSKSRKTRGKSESETFEGKTLTTEERWESIGGILRIQKVSRKGEEQSSNSVENTKQPNWFV